MYDQYTIGINEKDKNTVNASTAPIEMCERLTHMYSI